MWPVAFVWVISLASSFVIHSKPIPSTFAALSASRMTFHDFSLHQLIPQNALFSGLKKLRVKLAEEEPVGREVANLRFLTTAIGQSTSETGRDSKRENNFQIFNSEPQSKFFHLESHTGILRIARRIDRDQLCPTFRSCCPHTRLDDTISAAFDVVNGAAGFAEIMGGGYGDSKDPSAINAQLPECRLDLNVRSDDQYSKIILVHVHIADINDNAPVWPQFSSLSEPFVTKENGMHPRIMQVKLSENSLIDDSIALTPAFDADLGPNGIVRYTLSPVLPEFALQWPADLIEFTARADHPYASSAMEAANLVDSTRIASSSSSTFLEPDYSTGQRHELRLVVKKPLDRETQAVYDFTLTAFDGGSPARNASVPLRVLITDANDNSPKFQKDTYVVELRENARPHTPVIQVIATDADEGVNSRIKYRFSSLTKPEFMRLFSLDSVTGWIHVQWEIDYEVHKKILLTVEAVDGGGLPRASTCIVEILVRDENDHSPEIRFEPAHLTNYALVPENEKPGRLVAVFTATDQDSGENGRVTCQLTEPHKWRFDTSDQSRIDSMLANPLHVLFKLQQMHVPFSVMYKLTTAAIFDREITSRILVWIVCSDFGQPPRNTSASVSVRITDVNDERPRFARSSYYYSVREDTAVATPVFTINATDEDEGDNAQLTYWLTGPDADFFQVVEKTGQVSVRRALDREARDFLTFQIHCTDHGTPALNASAEVIVSITDVNDNAPELPEQVEFSVMENHTAAVPIGKIIVTDKDLGKNAEVSLSLIQCFAHLPVSEDVSSALWSERDYSTRTNFSGVKTNEMLYTFFIAKDGRIYLGHAKLDREKYPMYELMVRAEDHGVPRLSSTSVVKIHVLDVNDNAPRFLFPSSSNNTVYVPRLTKPGTVIAQLHAIDEDLYENGKVGYELQEDRLIQAGHLFELDSHSGLLRLKRPIDRVEQKINPAKVEHNQTGLAVSKNQSVMRSQDSDVGFTESMIAPSAYSLFVNAYDGGNPRLKSSTILRVLFTPPFYPPIHADLTGSTGGNIGQGSGTLYRNNRSRSSSGGRGSRKTIWLGGGFIPGDDDLTGIGILLGLVVAIGLFVCFVLLIVTILLRQAHHLRQRRRLVSTISSPKHVETGGNSETLPSSLPKSTPPLEAQLVDAQLYTPYISMYHPDPQTFLSIQRTTWKEPVPNDIVSM